MDYSAYITIIGEEGKKMKKIIIIVASVLVLAVVGTQLLCPLWVIGTRAEVNMDKDSGEMSYVFAKAYVPKNDEVIPPREGEHFISFDGKLPSENPDDYIDINLYFHTQNISLWNDYKIDATLEDASKYKENILMIIDASNPVTESLFKHEKVDARVNLLVYKNSMTEDQIKEMIKSIKLKIKYYGKYLGVIEKTISLDNCTDFKVNK